ncbi:hypothetical protein DUNSADRAFT_14972 [Dunaliella salina]|uniref:FHA domain-containing protein n=1 Tax=Dunaliella salina TaxID=3046 RepID=A0ABQ7H260_DUNSA|nr:hypothetical protein DUNSADRAFT_14972 [Dunaliella salina]|eukprot:KAF5840948.1 hypothetical protein DUNSADRAFT_14972 [Dunaliella salina]
MHAEAAAPIHRLSVVKESATEGEQHTDDEAQQQQLQKLSSEAEGAGGSGGQAAQTPKEGAASAGPASADVDQGVGSAAVPGQPDVGLGKDEGASARAGAASAGLASMDIDQGVGSVAVPGQPDAGVGKDKGTSAQAGAAEVMDVEGAEVRGAGSVEQEGRAQGGWASSEAKGHQHVGQQQQQQEPQQPQQQERVQGHGGGAEVKVEGMHASGISACRKQQQQQQQQQQPQGVEHEAGGAQTDEAERAPGSLSGAQAGGSSVGVAAPGGGVQTGLAAPAGVAAPAGGAAPARGAPAGGAAPAGGSPAGGAAPAGASPAVAEAPAGPPKQSLGPVLIANGHSTTPSWDAPPAAAAAAAAAGDTPGDGATGKYEGKQETPPAAQAQTPDRGVTPAAAPQALKGGGGGGGLDAIPVATTPAAAAGGTQATGETAPPVPQHTCTLPPNLLGQYGDDVLGFGGVRHQRGVFTFGEAKGLVRDLIRSSETGQQQHSAGMKESAQPAAAAAAAAAASLQGSEAAPIPSQSTTPTAAPPPSRGAAANTVPVVASAEELGAWRARFVDVLPRIAQLEAAASATTEQELDVEGALACLAGRTGRYLVKRTTVLLGRSTEAKGEVDVDLSCEGSCKVSRRQAYLTLEADGRFKITNAGQRLIVVDGKQVQQFESAGVDHLSLIEVGDVPLLLLVNKAAVQRIQRRTRRVAA